MSTKRTVSNTFTVSTVEDGESAPYYFLEWFAWSNDPSTNSVTTAPTIGGTWATSIPAQGSYAYLWRKSIRYVWNENTRQYSAEAAQYFRMSGLDGTSIKTRGQVASASQRGNGTATLTNGTTITMSDGDAVTQLDNGHMYQWVTEGGGVWIDLGQFKGESGVTYYTHIAWATNVTISGSTVTVTGFVSTKSPNDTTHIWMGTYVDTNSGQDSANASLYTWSNTKGDTGDKGSNAVTYTLIPSVNVVTKDQHGVPLLDVVMFSLYKTIGTSAPTVYNRISDWNNQNFHLFCVVNGQETEVTYNYMETQGIYVNYHDIELLYEQNDNIVWLVKENQTIITQLVLGVVKNGTDGENAVNYKISFAGSIFAADPNTGTLHVNIKGKVYEIDGRTTRPYNELSKNNLSLYFEDSQEQQSLVGINDFSVSGATFTTTLYDGAGWDDEQLFVVVFKIGNTEVARESIQIERYGENGQTGQRGKVGRFFYFGGTFDSNNNSLRYTVNDAQAPYFEHTENGQKRYHVFNYETNGSYTMSQMWAISSNWNNRPWESMTNDFKYIITEATFSQFAHLGSFIISKDYFISQYGTLFYNNNGAIGTTVINASNVSTLFGGSVAYAWFADSDPMVGTMPTVGNYKFRPTKCTDALSGEEWMAGGNVHIGQNGDVRVKGVIDADILYRNYQKIRITNGMAGLVNNVFSLEEWCSDQGITLPDILFLYTSIGNISVKLPDPTNYKGKMIEIFGMYDWSGFYSIYVSSDDSAPICSAIGGGSITSIGYNVTQSSYFQTGRARLISAVDTNVNNTIVYKWHLLDYDKVSIYSQY